MDEVEDINIKEKRDDARPFFQRNTGEIGIYIDAFTATPKNSKKCGSLHYFMMALNESMYEHLKKESLIAIKGCFEERDLLDGCILEEFTKGVVLSVGFDREECLDQTISAQDSGVLTAFFQEVLVTSSLLESCQATAIQLRSRLWRDEYDACRSEIKARDGRITSITLFEKDYNILKAIREYQRWLITDVTRLRHLESRLDQQLGDLIHSMKQVIPHRLTRIRTLREFLKYARDAARRNGKQSASAKNFLVTLDDSSKLFRDVVTNVCYALAQIHAIVEKGKQKQLKAKIKTIYRRVSSLLNRDHSLEEVVYGPWQGKVLNAEQPLFLGAISLVPLTIESIVEIDHCTDEYISEFPDQI